jgi:uncharacterized membrane protein
MDDSAYAHLMITTAQVFELIAAAVLVVGLLFSFYLAGRTYLRAGGAEAYKILRQAFGGVILLGLELLVAGDLIRTVAVDPTVESALALGLIVLIRTILSFSIQIEVDGVLPWRRALTSGATVIKSAASASAGA